MKSRSFAFAALRILSLWIFAYYGIMNLLLTGSLIYEYYNQTHSQIDFLIYSLFIFLFASVVSWFLWFKADALSHKFIITEVNENNIESFNQEKILSVSLIILGFYFIFDSIPDLIENTVSAYVFSPDAAEMEMKKNIISVLHPSITLFIGLFCIIQTNKIKDLIYKLRNLGTEKAD